MSDRQKVEAAERPVSKANDGPMPAPARDALVAIYQRGGQIKQANGDSEPGWWYLVRESELLEALHEAVKDSTVADSARWELIFVKKMIHSDGCPFTAGDEYGEGHVECECYVSDLWDALREAFGAALDTGGPQGRSTLIRGEAKAGGSRCKRGAPEMAAEPQPSLPMSAVARENGMLHAKLNSRQAIITGLLEDIAALETVAEAARVVARGGSDARLQEALVALRYALDLTTTPAAFDTTTAPQSSPESDPSNSDGGGAGAGLDLDRLTLEAGSALLRPTRYGVLVTETEAKHLADAVLALVERVRLLEAALERIIDNAESWHGVAGQAGSDGHAKACAVIATWGRAARAAAGGGAHE